MSTFKLDNFVFALCESFLRYARYSVKNICCIVNNWFRRYVWKGRIWRRREELFVRLALSYSVFTSWAKPQLLGCKWDTKALSMPPLQTLCANSVTNIKRRCRSDDEEKARITIQNGNERNDLKDIAVMQRIHAYFDALHQYAAMQVHCSAS